MVQADATPTGRFWRCTIAVHRYLGIGVGLIVLVWCVSGIVMMYVPYPVLDPDEQLTGLQPLRLDACCGLTDGQSLSNAAVKEFRVEMLLDRPVMRAVLADGRQRVVDLTSGRVAERWSDEALLEAARAYGLARGLPRLVARTRIERDQWTVHGRFDPHRPLHKFTSADGAEWYVSGNTAEVVQFTTSRERFWNWSGSVAHWLYPTVLRRHPAAWTQTVIWLTVIGLFLAVTGIVIGIRQYRAGAPYRGWMLWHHYAGLVFGVLTLAWLASGLASMNPWGMLESRDFGGERAALNGGSVTLAEAVLQVGAVRAHAPPETVRLSAALWAGQPFFVAWDRDGGRTRIAAAGAAPPVALHEVEEAFARTGFRPTAIERLEMDDAYYYGRYASGELPVWRATFANGDRIYLSALTGRMVHALDSNGRASRWLFDALHKGDFHPVLRGRPLRDVFLLVLLAGVIAGVGSGVYLAIRRVVRSV